MTEISSFIDGGIAVDNRGMLQFCNEFDMEPVKRFYVVSNHQPQFVRAWHAHQHETKYAFVATGAALFGVVKVDDWDNPDPHTEIQQVTLSDKRSGVLKIPGGCAHGFMTLLTDTKVFFFSTETIEQSLEDDFRYPFDYWDPWSIVPR